MHVLHNILGFEITTTGYRLGRYSLHLLLPIKELHGVGVYKLHALSNLLGGLITPLTLVHRSSNLSS